MNVDDLYGTSIEEDNLPPVDISLDRFQQKVDQYANANDLARYEKYKRLRRLIKKGSSKALYAQASIYGREHEELIKKIGELREKADKSSRKEVAFGLLAERLDQGDMPTYDAFVQSLRDTSYSQELLRHMDKGATFQTDDSDVLRRLDLYLKRHRARSPDVTVGRRVRRIGESASIGTNLMRMSRQECLIRQKQHEAAALTGLSPHFFDLFINNEKFRRLEEKMPTASPEEYERCLIRWHRLKAIKAAVLADDARAARDVCLKYNLDRYAIEQALMPLHSKEAKSRAKEISWLKMADKVAIKEARERLNLNRALGRFHL